MSESKKFVSDYACDFDYNDESKLKSFSETIIKLKEEADAWAAVESKVLELVNNKDASKKAGLIEAATKLRIEALAKTPLPKPEITPPAQPENNENNQPSTVEVEVSLRTEDGIPMPFSAMADYTEQLRVANPDISFPDPPEPVSSATPAPLEENFYSSNLPDPPPVPAPGTEGSGKAEQ